MVWVTRMIMMIDPCYNGTTVANPAHASPSEEWGDRA
jgi:hypothetical protein